MVGTRSAVCLCLSVLLAAPALAQNREQESGTARPRVTNPDQMRGRITRATGNKKTVERAVFETGLEGGFEGEYEVRRSIEYSEQMGEDEATRELMTESHTLVVSLASRARRADGLWTVTGTFKQVASRIETSDGPVSVDFDLTRPLPEDAENFSGLDAMLPALKDATFTLLVDANGNVTEVEGVPTAGEVIPNLGIIPPGLLRPLEREEFAVLMSKVFNAEGGVERTQAVQGLDEEIPTWTTLEQVELGASGTLNVSRAWTPRAGKGEGVEAVGQYAISVEPPAVRSDAAPVCTIAGYQGVGRLLWRDEGGLQYLSSTEELAMRWTFGAEELRTTQTSTTILQRVEH